MNKTEKPWYKRWQVWLAIIIVVGVLGNILPDASEDKKEEVSVKDTVEEKPETNPEPAEIKPLTKDEVLSKFEVDSDSKPYINGQFIFAGNRKDTADYYALADTGQYRNASVIFKDGQIARVKLIPGEGQDVNKLFEDFGITDEPRKLSGAAGVYEVALIPIFWSQNIEKYPFDLD
ncbi:hypothetical protein 8F11_88 [uncultured Caudovirales phage]|uniref:Uncharacterized protein n=1 Tax=uncultured Caudovirales phage TaxID=2100421 RepID=A0A2H4J2P9_9CAUD|nr:hypothetical protein 8F11_88 [uncultured Caudovirales phage]